MTCASPRAAGYALLGSIGSIALSIPLYGYLAYWASLLYSLLIGWPFFGLAIGLGAGHDGPDSTFREDGRAG